MSTPLALDGRRLVVVTGKGGVGKSTVAAALARAAAAAGRRVLAVDIDASGVTRVLGCRGATSEPQSVSTGLAAAAVDGPAALRDVVHGMMPLAILARRLLESATFQVLAAAAPGLAEFLVLAKILEWLDATRLGRRRWDLVVVDAPASGHSLPLLTAPQTLGTIARLGPAARTLGRIEAILADPEQTALWLVTLPEELAVRETIELHHALSGPGGLVVAPPIVNAMPRRRFRDPDVATLEAPALDASHPMIQSARLEIRRRRAAVDQTALLRAATGTRPVELPYDPTGASDEHIGRLVAAVRRATGLDG